MAETTRHNFVPQLTLQASTAADLMSDNLISLEKGASVQDAIALMVDRGYTAAPVIDQSGKPLGVITVTDILIHNRELVRYLKTGDVKSPGRPATAEAKIEVVDRATVGEIMTPAIFTVMEDAPAKVVVETLTSLGVHHLFVSDRQGILIGVISLGDILRKLK